MNGVKFVRMSSLASIQIVSLQAHRVRFRHRCSISQPAFREAWCILDLDLGDQQLEPTVVFDVFEGLRVNGYRNEFQSYPHRACKVFWTQRAP